VWSPSFRGRDDSRPTADLGAVGLRDFAGDLQDVLRHVGPATVVGYSLGGLVLQIVASDTASRDLVERAVLLCSLPPRGISALSGPVLRRSWRYLPAMFGNGLLLPGPEDIDAMLLNDVPADDRSRWHPLFVADSGRAARQSAFGAVGVDASDVRCPVLVVSAQDDRISPPSIQPKLVARYGAEHLALAKHAHLLTIEPGWEAVLEAVLDRLERPRFPQPD
jgi:pimeloyl-ACP methyl ester carboxylesterase